MNQDKQDTVKDIMLKVMQHYGYRHQYEVAKYFNVTAQTLSGWIKQIQSLRNTWLNTRKKSPIRKKTRELI